MTEFERIDSNTKTMQSDTTRAIGEPVYIPKKPDRHVIRSARLMLSTTSMAHPTTPGGRIIGYFFWMYNAGMSTQSIRAREEFFFYAKWAR